MGSGRGRTRVTGHETRRVWVVSQARFVDTRECFRRFEGGKTGDECHSGEGRAEGKKYGNITITEYNDERMIDFCS